MLADTVAQKPQLCRKICHDNLVVFEAMYLCCSSGDQDSFQRIYDSVYQLHISMDRLTDSSSVLWSR